MDVKHLGFVISTFGARLLGFSFPAGVSWSNGQERKKGNGALKGHQTSEGKGEGDQQGRGAWHA